MYHPLLINVILLFFLGLGSCANPKSDLVDKTDVILAKVGSKTLYKSQVSELISEGTSPVDSTTIVNGFLQNWIREGLMILEAEKQVAADININKLVDDYRSSLLVYNFENKLIKEKLDTIIEAEEKQEYYEMNKNNYKLSHPIFKCVAGKFNKKNKNLSSIKKAFEENSYELLESILGSEAIKYQIDTSRYLVKEDLLSWMPVDMGKKLENTKKVISFSDNNYQYFVKMIEYHDENSIPPFYYIESKLNKSILSERKNNLLNEYRQQLYLKGISEKKFEVFNN